MKRLVSLAMTLLLALSLCTVSAAAKSDGWWEQEYWDTETLVTLGAVPPSYNAATGVYEISKAEQLLFMSGEWKQDDTNGDGQPDAPRNGSYLLMNDIDMAPLMTRLGKAITAAAGVKTTGYMPPISANKENKKNADDGYFTGTFDGGGYAVLNHRVVRHGEYAGFFGYIGYKTEKAYVRNLALLNIEVIGDEDAGTLSSGCYADVDNVLVTGSVTVPEGGGGLTSSVKSGGGEFAAHITNCFVLVDVYCGTEAGALTGAIAGEVKNCFVAGSVTADEPDTIGGLAGAYDAGVGASNNAVLTRGLYSTEGGKKVGALFGSLEGDSGRTIQNNLVWDGMAMQGTPSYKHPAQPVETRASYETLTTKATYTDVLGWDFETVWEWVGKDNAGYPVLKTFSRLAKTAKLDKLLSAGRAANGPVLLGDNPLLHTGDAGEAVTLTAQLVPQFGGKLGAAEVTLFYGSDDDGSAFTESVPMLADANGVYSAAFPVQTEGEYYYYYAAKAGGKTLTFPYDITEAIPLTLSVPVIDGTPKAVTVSPGTDADKIGFNFITSTDADAGLIRYRAAGETAWTELPCTSYVSFVDAGWDEIVSHWVDAEGLAPDAAYEYQAVGMADGQAFESEVYTFTTLPDDGPVSVLVISDLQAEEEEGYEPFTKSYAEFMLPTLGAPDLLLGTGDNVENGFKAEEWDNLFNMCGDILATQPTVLLPGNAEHAGDLFYKNYTARTNLPGGMDDELMGEYVGYCIVGDVCFVFVNTEVYTDTADGAQLLADRAEYYQKQKAWAKEIFENSGCAWRVVSTHRGPYTTDHNGLADVPEMVELCDELMVDLFLNGHDHSYIRVTAKDNQKAEIGAATTYLTTSSMGEKLDDYSEGLIDELVAVHIGSSDREQQKFAHLTFDYDGMHVTVYERGEDEDFSDYQVIDSFDVPESLTVQAGLVAKPTAPAAEAAAPLAGAETAETPAKTPTQWIYLALAIVLVAAAVYIIIRKRKQTKA